jgi:hypothetical protein
VKRILSILTLLVFAAAAFAGGPGPSWPSPAEEISAALEQYRDAEVGKLTVSDLEDIAARLALAHRKAAFVPRSAKMSMMMPGLGQFVNGEPGAGALFMAGSAAIAAGTIAATWLLLPLDVQPQSLFVAPLSSFEARFQGHTPLEYLPAAAAVVGGMLLDGALRAASAHHAARLAAKNIEEGRVTFEPAGGPMGPGFMLGVKIRAR